MIGAGDPFPTVEMNLPSKGMITLPEEVAGEWAYVAFFRGHW